MNKLITKLTIAAAAVSFSLVSFAGAPQNLVVNNTTKYFSNVALIKNGVPGKPLAGTYGTPANGSKPTSWFLVGVLCSLVTKSSSCQAEVYLFKSSAETHQVADLGKVTLSLDTGLIATPSQPVAGYKLVNTASGALTIKVV